MEEWESRFATMREQHATQAQLRFAAHSIKIRDQFAKDMIKMAKHRSISLQEKSMWRQFWGLIILRYFKLIKIF